MAESRLAAGETSLLERRLEAEQRAWRDAARLFARQRLLPRLRRSPPAACDSAAIMAEMHACGLAGEGDATVSAPPPCAIALGLIAHELEYADALWRILWRRRVLSVSLGGGDAAAGGSGAVYLAAWGALGAAASCLQTARRFTVEGNQFGRVLAANLDARTRLLDLEDLLGMRLQACLRRGDERNAGVADIAAADQLFANCRRDALHVAQTARELLGGDHIAEEFGINRHINNLANEAIAT